MSGASRMSQIDPMQPAEARGETLDGLRHGFPAGMHGGDDGTHELTEPRGDPGKNRTPYRFCTAALHNLSLTRSPPFSGKYP